MAKQRGPVASTFTGRVGNVVGAKMKGGEYVTRSYQPSVKNPKTLRQRVSRQRLALASQYASVLAPALAMGYAKAASSTKMSPRNMFVRDIVPVNSGVFSLNGESVNVNYKKIPMSKKMGIDANLTYTIEDDDRGVTINVEYDGLITLNEGEKIGAVITFVGVDIKQAVVRKSVMNSSGIASVTLTHDEFNEINPAMIYAFLKKIPASKNDISAEEEPWKYPSATSATIAVV